MVALSHVGAKNFGVWAHLSAWLRAGTALVLAERTPSPFYDMIEGMDNGWWEYSADMETPLSPLRDSDARRRWLDAAGFGFGSAHTFSGLGCAIEVVTAVKKEPGQILPKAETAESDWLILVDTTSVDTMLVVAKKWQQLGRKTRMVVVGDSQNPEIENPYDAAQWALWFAENKSDARRELLFAIGINFSPDQDDVFAAISKRVIAAAMLAKGWEKAGKPAFRLWLLGGGGFAAAKTGTGRIVPSQSGLWGMGRCLVNEAPGLDTRSIDIHAEKMELRDIDALARFTAEADAGGAEREVVIIDGAAHFPRIEEAEISESSKPAAREAKLVPSPDRDLDKLAWITVESLPPGAGEIKIRLEAVGLNYRDVMWASGLLPEHALEGGYSGPTLGLEGVGEVVAVGDGVDDIEIGARVMCIAPQCFATHTITRREMAVRLPDALSSGRASTIPVAYCTAWYGLKHLARVAPGESLLVHGAAGGVGMAAIRLAKHLGLRVFATAGMEEKRNFLHYAGVEKILDSRSLAFAEEVLEATDGRGVDVVLNSIAGEAARRSVQCLAPFGRFVELGKRDIYGNAALELYPFRNNISYFAVDLDQLAKLQPKLCRQLFEEISQLLEDGLPLPLPYMEFPAAASSTAFRRLRESRHIGKLVV
ncbi:MAG: zinc-binding dehydrogenase, partial [Planctomycetes bacterium]|nr:zinc-binding dehydrogenase [Planctomycetota bacterium]